MPKNSLPEKEITDLANKRTSDKMKDANIYGHKMKAEERKKK
jgi:hypothetical protein